MGHRRRSAYRALLAVVALGAVVCLSACPYVDRIAIRLNGDQTVDVLSCESLDQISGARLYLDDALNTTLKPDDLGNSGDGLGPGEVLHLADVSVSGDWSTLSVYVDGSLRSADWAIDGTFNREDLTVGERAWARTGVFVGTVAVDGCEPH